MDRRSVMLHEVTLGRYVVGVLAISAISATSAISPWLAADRQQPAEVLICNGPHGPKAIDYSGDQCDQSMVGVHSRWPEP